MEMRLAGATFERIAEALGVSRAAAFNAVERGVADLRDEGLRDADQLREIELARLDRLLMGVWGSARSGDLQAVDRALKIIDRRAKLLGLDQSNASLLGVHAMMPAVLEVVIPGPRIGPHGAQAIEGEVVTDDGS